MRITFVASRCYGARLYAGVDCLDEDFGSMDLSYRHARCKTPIGSMGGFASQGAHSIVSGYSAVSSFCCFLLCKIVLALRFFACAIVSSCSVDLPCQ